MNTNEFETLQPSEEIINTVRPQEEAKPKIPLHIFLLIVALLVPIVFSAGYYSRSTQNQGSTTKMNEPTRFIESSVINDTVVSDNTTVSDDYKSSWSSHLIPNEKLIHEKLSNRKY